MSDALTIPKMNFPDIKETENLLILSWDEQARVFKENLEVIRLRPTKKAIHDIRVAVKKLRCYLRLNGELTGVQSVEEFKEVKVFFKRMGKLRDFENTYLIKQKLLQDEKFSLLHFKKYLQSAIRLEKQWVRQSALDFNFSLIDQISGKMHHCQAGITNDIIVGKIKELAADIFKKVHTLSDDLEKNVHEIRKLLKALFYWIAILPAEILESQARYKKIEKLLDKMGDWQDLYMFLYKVKQYKKQYSVKGTEEIEFLKRIREKAKDMQKEILNNIARKIKLITPT
ncbi:MAG TPA: CHAD domain-containing protein [Chitinophagaceae bacterium]|nr:CHAD domain-containing protein [Chitinophagaceae bacterium]